MDARESKQTSLQLLHERLESGRMRAARTMIHSLHPSEIAHLLESLPHRQRNVIWEMVDPEDEGDVLVEVSDEVRDGLIEDMQNEELLAALDGMELDDLADLLIDLPETVTQQVLQSLDDQDQDRLRQVLAYDEDSAGGLMNVDIVTVRPDVTLEVVCRYLRARGEMSDGTDAIFVVDRDNRYLGSLYLSRLLTQDEETLVAAVMSTDNQPIPAHTPSTEVVWEFEHRDLLSAPVVDDDFRVVGRITIDDVVDVIREEGEHSLLTMAGLDEEEDMFAPIIQSARRRWVWLGVNLVTALLAAVVLYAFEPTLDQIVATAVLFPIVMSMGGIAGTQTLTLMVRGMATGQVSARNTPALLRKELAVGLLNGVVFSIVIALIAMLWDDDVPLGLVMAAAILLNLLAGALAGALVPVLLRRMSIDPALAGGVVLTTVTDVIGIVAFIGLASFVLLGR